MVRHAVFAYLFFSAASILADKPPKPGTFYKDSELNISKKEVKGTKIHITFRLNNKDFYWCPGVKIQHTPKATVVTFVRAKTSKSGDVDQKAKYDRKLLSQTVAIETKNRDTYIRNGAKSFKKIFASKNKSAKTKNASVNKAGGKPPAKKEQPSSRAFFRRMSQDRPTAQEESPTASSPKPHKPKVLFNEFAIPTDRE